MQKLLIHINILLAFSVLFCSHSAFGQSAPRVDIDESSSTSYGADLRAIDLGLSIYWGNYNVGSNGSNRGNMYKWNTADNWKNGNSDWGTYWRTPTLNEITELKNNVTSKSYNNNVLTLTINQKQITIPASGYNNLAKDYETSDCIFWSNTGTTVGAVDYGYVFHYCKKDNTIRVYYSTVDQYDWLGLTIYRIKFPTWVEYEVPIRLVIDKVTLTVTTAGGNTITKTYPKGTKVRLSAYKDDCHKTHHWETNTNAPNINEATPEVTITSDITYTAFFERITYNASVSSNDEDMGNAQIVSTAEPDGKYKCGSIKMTATPTDDCHELIYWENGSGEKFYPNTNDENYTCTTNGAGVNTLEVPFNGNNTFTANFSTKTTTVVATTEDDQKGWVGLNVWK